MIIIRKPRTKGWQARMSSYILVAYHAFVASDLYRKSGDADKMYEMALVGSKNLNRAVEAGGFFSILDMFKWIDKQKSEMKGSS